MAPWLTEEVVRLHQVVAQTPGLTWQQRADLHFRGRSAHSVYQKYRSSLPDLAHGHFTPEEDAFLWFASFHFRKQSDVADFIKTRCYQQFWPRLNALRANDSWNVPLSADEWHHIYELASDELSSDEPAIEPNESAWFPRREMDPVTSLAAPEVDLNAINVMQLVATQEAPLGREPATEAGPTPPTPEYTTHDSSPTDVFDMLAVYEPIQLSLDTAQASMFDF